MIGRVSVGCVALFLAVVLSALAQPVGPPLVQVKATPDKSVFKDATPSRPILIKTAEEAAKHFSKDDLEAVKKQVDFSKQFVLVFAWQGSGGDKLTHVIAESFPEQIFFKLEPGKTRDLRPHSHVYALRENVRWSAPKGR